MDKNQSAKKVRYKKFEGGPLKAMAMKNIINFGYTNSVQSTLLLGGSGGMPPTGKF